MSKKNIVPKEEIEKLYKPEYFHEHGDNPALKKFMNIMVENVRDGRLPDYRTYVIEKYTKFHYARNWEDFLQNDLKLYTFPRSLVGFTYATWIFLLTSRWARSFLPLGEHGITRINQTQFYHLYGPIGVAGVLALPAAGAYLWYKTAKFTANKFYYHVILGDTNWIYEQEKNNPSVGEYYFSDGIWTSDEAFPDLARGELAKKPNVKPEWASWK